MVVIVTPYRRYEIPHHCVAKSGLLSQMASKSPSEIVLSEKMLKDNVVMRILSFLMGRESADEVPLAIEDDEVVLSLLLASDYLIIPELYNKYSSMVMNALTNCSSAQQVRDTLKIQNDFTDEEDFICSRENPWAEEAGSKQARGSGNAKLFEHTPFDMTVSMIVDGSPKSSSKLYPPPFAFQKTPPVDADIVQFVQPRRPIAPVPDEHVSSCTNHEKCGIEFSSFNRRHHCRHCGRIFCADCSSKYIALSDSMNVYHGYSTPYGTVKSWMSSWIPNAPASGVETTHRVCDGCYQTISEQERLGVYIRAFRMLALEIPLLKRAGTVCSNWRTAAIYCLSLLREIQYQLPTSQLAKEDMKLLWANKYHWAGHSKWLIQFLKAVDWKVPADAEQAVDILLHHPKRLSCWQTMCSRSCTERLSAGDALLLLNEDMPNKEVRNFAIDILDETNNEELSCYIPLLVHNLRYADPSSLISLLLKKAIADEQICNDLFWALSTASESRTFKRLYNSVQHKLIIAVAHAHGDEKAMQLVQGQDLVQFLEGIPGGVTTAQLQLLLADSISVNYETAFPLPVDPLMKVKNIKWQDVVVKQSATAPIVVPCVSTTPQLLSERTCPHGGKPGCASFALDEFKFGQQVPSAPPLSPSSSGFDTVTHKLATNASAATSPLVPLYSYRFMFKREDMRKDQIVLNVIKAMDLIIKKELHSDLNVLTYRVIPTSSANGLLEIVPNAITLFDVVKEYKSIHIFLTTHNGDRMIDEVLATYMKSLAAWTVITHLLGVGDRHMDNIMLTNSGIIFHIDYGFVLGKDPKPIAPNIRMSESMIDGMGGRANKHYTEFKNICADVFLCLRRHTQLFLNLLMMLPKADPPIADLIVTPKYLEDELSKRFLPGQTEAEATTTIQSLIDKCDTFAQVFTDFLHTHAKEKTIAEGVHKVAAGSAVALGMMAAPMSYFMSGWGAPKKNGD